MAICRKKLLQRSLGFSKKRKLKKKACGKKISGNEFFLFPPTNQKFLTLSTYLESA
jgi:hypothetical protein